VRPESDAFKKAEPYLAQIDPRLREILNAIPRIPDPQDRVTAALYVASQSLGCACGVMQASTPGLEHVSLHDIAETVSELIVGLLHEGKPN